MKRWIYIEPDLKQISSWFTYTPAQTFKLKRGQTTASFKIKVTIPKDAQYKDYNGVFRVRAVPSNQNVMGISITQGVRLDAGLIVTSVDVSNLSVTAIKVLDSELNQPIKVQITAENQGNTDAKPTVKVKILDLQQNVLEEHEMTNIGSIKPSETGVLSAEFKTNLPSGEYFVEVTVFLDGKELRKETMVFQINNIPEDKPQEENKPSIINSIFTEGKNNLPYILVAAIALLLIYFLLGKMWSMKDLKEKSLKWWAVLLGSQKIPRLFLSFFIALQIMLILMFYPVLSLKSQAPKSENGETQGVQDSKIDTTPLNVFPPIKITEYLIYEKADTGSKVLYTANENERFNVEEETDGWYKVKLNDTTYGWLQKYMVKSTETQGE